MRAFTCARLVLWVSCAGWASTAALAQSGNIDPNDTGAQYSWAENTGWLNFEPEAAGTPVGQVVVSQTELRGFVWSENAGWINLNCANHGTCAQADFKVLLDAAGRLSGHAWGENIGWIVFAPSIAGT